MAVIARAHQVATGSKLSGRQSFRLLWASSKPLSAAVLAWAALDTVDGPLVVAALGWKLLSQEQWSDHAAGHQAEEAHKIGSFYPLTMPLTVGPGSMSVAITIRRRKEAGIAPLPLLAEHATGALLGVLAIAVSIYLAYRFADNIARLLGETGLEVLVRLSAFILMCIGIEIIWNGYSALTAAH